MIYEVYLKFTFTRITLLSQWLFRPLRHHANLPESRVKKTTQDYFKFMSADPIVKELLIFYFAKILLILIPYSIHC